MQGRTNRICELFASFFVGVGNGITTVLVTNLLLLYTGSTFFVGLAEGVPALIPVLIAFPVGVLFDKTKSVAVRDLGLLLVLIALAFQSVCVMSFGLIFGFSGYWAIFGALLVQNLGQGFLQGPVEALWQNSVRTGERSKWNNWKYVSGTAGSVAGPLLAILLALSVHSNDWSLPDLSLPWSLGCCASMVGYLFRVFVTENDTLGLESDSATEVYENSDAHKGRGRRFCGLGYDSVPYIQLSTDIWYGIASGMTIKFFPLWLADLGLTPIELSAAVALQFLAISVFAILAKLVGNAFGRMEAAFWSRCLGLCFMLLIIIGPSFFWNLKWLCAFLQIVRTGLMNASSGITRSVVNDFLPKDKRARWNALDQVVSFGWSASALLGGFVLSELSFQYLFLITFLMQVVGLIPMFVLAKLVPKEERSVALQITGV